MKKDQKKTAQKRRTSLANFNKSGHCKERSLAAGADFTGKWPAEEKEQKGKEK